MEKAGLDIEVSIQSWSLLMSKSDSGGKSFFNSLFGHVCQRRHSVKCQSRPSFATSVLSCMKWPDQPVKTAFLAYWELPVVLLWPLNHATRFLKEFMTILLYITLRNLGANTATFAATSFSVKQRVNIIVPTQQLSHSFSQICCRHWGPLLSGERYIASLFNG